MTEKNDDLNPQTPLDPRQATLASATLAVDIFWRATLDQIEKKHPERAQHDRDVVERGEAHILCVTRTDGRRIVSSLVLVKPEWGADLADYEMRVCGSLAAGMGDPSKVQIIDLAKMN